MIDHSGMTEIIIELEDIKARIEMDDDKKTMEELAMNAIDLMVYVGAFKKYKDSDDVKYFVTLERFLMEQNGHDNPWDADTLPPYDDSNDNAVRESFVACVCGMLELHNNVYGDESSISSKTMVVYYDTAFGAVQAKLGISISPEQFKRLDFENILETIGVVKAVTEH